jgi:hypothetical protein
MMAGMPIDMFIQPEKDPRTDPPTRGDKRATLTGFLGWHRGTLEVKCSGLDAAALNHMIEEYARHNGHADLLRERIDGAVGK